MKCCLSSRCEISYLKQADEVKYAYQDRGSIIRRKEDFHPNATIVLHHLRTDPPIEWEYLENIKTVYENKFILALYSLQECEEAKARGFRFYLNLPVTSYWELRALKELGVEYVHLGAPLFFDIERAASVGVPVRAVPNVAYADGLPHDNGLCGCWIRPEDLKMYEPYVQIIEFEDCENHLREQAMFRIYMQGNGWSGPMEQLITNYDYPGEGRMFNPRFTVARLNCNHICQTPGRVCRICKRLSQLADPDLITDYATHKKETLD